MTREQIEAFMDDIDRRIELLHLTKEQLVDIIRKLEEQLKYSNI